MLTSQLTREVARKITRDLEEMGMKFDSWKYDAITGHLSIALSQAYNEGRRDGLLEVMASLRRQKQQPPTTQQTPGSSPLKTQDAL